MHECRVKTEEGHRHRHPSRRNHNRWSFFLMITVKSAPSASMGGSLQQACSRIALDQRHARTRSASGRRRHRRQPRLFMFMWCLAASVPTCKHDDDVDMRRWLRCSWAARAMSRVQRNAITDERGKVCNRADTRHGAEVFERADARDGAGEVLE